MGALRPRGHLEQLTTPTPAIFGSNDPLVPVPASLARLRDTADHTARPRQINIIPGADHRLQVGASTARIPQLPDRMVPRTATAALTNDVLRQFESFARNSASVA